VMKLKLGIFWSVAAEFTALAGIIAASAAAPQSPANLDMPSSRDARNPDAIYQ
jgi:hypothetical protein